jgi:hypothetical protein
MEELSWLCRRTQNNSLLSTRTYSLEPVFSAFHWAIDIALNAQSRVLGAVLSPYLSNDLLRLAVSRHRVSAIAPHGPWLPIGRHSYRSHLATCNSQNLPLQSKSNRCNSRGCIHFLRSLLLSRSTILTGCRISTCPWTQHPDSTFNRVSSNPAFRALSSPIEPQADLEPELKSICFFHILARLAWGHQKMQSSRCLSCNTPNECSHLVPPFSVFSVDTELSPTHAIAAMHILRPFGHAPWILSFSCVPQFQYETVPVSETLKGVANLNWIRSAGSRHSALSISTRWVAGLFKYHQ